MKFKPRTAIAILIVAVSTTIAIRRATAEDKTVAVRVLVHNDTIRRPLSYNAEIVGGDQPNAWLLKPATKFGGDFRVIGGWKVGQKSSLTLILEGVHGPKIVIPFTVTAEMNPAGSVRDALDISINDSEVEVFGLPYKAATGKLEMKVRRP